MAAIILILAAGILIAGGTAGLILFVSVGIAREERRFSRTRQLSLTRQAPGPVSARARSINGLYVGRRAAAVPVRTHADAVPTVPHTWPTLN